MIRESAAGSDDRRTAYRLTAFGRNVVRAEAERLRDLVMSAHAKKLLTDLYGVLAEFVVQRVRVGSKSSSRSALPLAPADAR